MDQAEINAMILKLTAGLNNNSRNEIQETSIIESELTRMQRQELITLYGDLDIPMSPTGIPLSNESAVLALLAHDYHYKEGIFFDDFVGDIIIKNKAQKMRLIADDDYLFILLKMQTVYGLHSVKKATIQNAVYSYARFNTVSSCSDWIKAQKWDGVARIEEFFHKYCGDKSSKYTRQVSINFWVGMIARAIEPGCKVDNMIILEGGQGSLKSTLLGAIGGDWYSENTADYGSKDFYINLQGVLLVEIAELDTFSKSDINTVKRVTTSQHDRYRAPYDKHTNSHPRRCIFAGSTNELEYLNDPTGARRFWPIKCGQLDLDGVIADRPQLFAEAYKMFMGGVKWYEKPFEAELIQEQRRQKHPWEDVIEEWITDRRPFKMSELLSDCLNIDLNKQTNANSRQVGSVLKLLGWRLKVHRVALDSSDCGVKSSKLWSYDA